MELQPIHIKIYSAMLEKVRSESEKGCLLVSGDSYLAGTLSGTRKLAHSSILQLTF
jgi:hypothetical protein